MKTCGMYRGSLIDLQYGLLDAEAERGCRAHLESCEACAAELVSLRRLGEALAPRPNDLFGGEDRVDWSRFAQRTVARALNAEDAAHPLPGSVGSRAPRRSGALAWLTMPPAWATAMAGLVVLAGLAVLTSFYLPTSSTVAPESSLAGRAEDGVFVPQTNLDNLSVNLARQNTAEYLTQTRAVLVSMMDVNIECDKDHVDISAERAKATELLRRQRLIVAELNRQPLARAQDVCNDLEKLLLEVASLADCTKGEDLKTIRDVVEKRQILVRMELLSQELARRAGADA